MHLLLLIDCAVGLISMTFILVKIDALFRVTARNWTHCFAAAAIAAAVAIAAAGREFCCSYFAAGRCVLS